MRNSQRTKILLFVTLVTFLQSATSVHKSSSLIRKSSSDGNLVQKSNIGILCGLEMMLTKIIPSVIKKLVKLPIFCWPKTALLQV